MEVIWRVLYEKGGGSPATEGNELNANTDNGVELPANGDATPDIPTPKPSLSVPQCSERSAANCIVCGVAKVLWNKRPK